MVSLLGGILTLTLGTALVVWGKAVRAAMAHDGALRQAGRLPRGATSESS
ncbi:hypothetical protein [Roseicella aquatilis]|nr:hypothetical protein [Roseicella aquatilis]